MIRNSVSRLFHGAWLRFCEVAGGVVAKIGQKRSQAPFSWAPTYDPQDSAELAPVVKLDGGGALRSDDGKTLIVNATEKPLFVAFAPQRETFTHTPPLSHARKAEVLRHLAEVRRRAERERVMDTFYDRDPSREARTIAEVFINRAKGE
jgi:hypothetical protein